MSVNYFTSGRRGPGSSSARARFTRAFTLTELLIAAVIVGVLTMVGLPAYSEHVERAKVAQAISDILEISQQLNRYYSDRMANPASLADIGYDGKLDPWGKPYVYLNLELAGNNGKARKNKKLHPINSDYDLYSIGKDLDTALPLTAKPSRDDIVRANDGSFVNLASKYDK